MDHAEVLCQIGHKCELLASVNDSTLKILFHNRREFWHFYQKKFILKWNERFEHEPTTQTAPRHVPKSLTGCEVELKSNEGFFQ